jgi:Tol biopolymer transport system component
MDHRGLARQLAARRTTVFSKPSVGWPKDGAMPAFAHPQLTHRSSDSAAYGLPRAHFWRNFTGLLLLVFLTSCDSCIERNPDVCCTSDTECARLGLPPGSASDYGCRQSYVCRDFYCVPEEGVDAGVDDASNRRCASELLFQRGSLFQTPQVLRIDLESFTEVPVSNGVDGDADPEWSPDGNQVVLNRNLTSIWVMNRDGSNPVQLASETGNGLFSPTWSPDGTKVAYTSQPLPGGMSALLVAASDGTGTTNLTPGQDAQAPLDWSPDGMQILFTSIRTGNYEVFKMFANGTTPTNLTNQGGTDGRNGLRWSPDGSKILYIGSSQVWVANADGTSPKNLTGTTSTNRDPVWSHDGNLIFFVRGPDTSGEIWVMNSNGAGQHLLIGGSIDVDPQPSPDGAKIAWSSRRDGNYEIYLANIDGSNPVRVTNNSLPDERPRWRPCP